MLTYGLSNRGDFPLPPGFDLVLLGKKERDKVIAVGKNPDRKEDDIDEEGNLIDTEFELELIE